MKNRKIKYALSLLLLTSLLNIPFTALALEVKDFSQTEFQSLTDNNQIILLDFHAKWCSICKKQTKIFKKLSEEGAYKNIHLLKIDYDQSTELKKKYNVFKQSTLILLKGDQEIDRVIAATDEFRIKMLLDEGAK